MPVTLIPMPPEVLDNQAHVLPPATVFDRVEHTTAGFCRCDPSVHEVYSDNRDRTVGFVVRHHANGIADSFDRAALPPELARLLA